MDLNWNTRIIYYSLLFVIFMFIFVIYLKNDNVVDINKVFEEKEK